MYNSTQNTFELKKKLLLNSPYCAKIALPIESISFSIRPVDSSSKITQINLKSFHVKEYRLIYDTDWIFHPTTSLLREWFSVKSLLAELQFSLLKFILDS